MTTTITGDDWETHGDTVGKPIWCVLVRIADDEGREVSLGSEGVDSLRMTAARRIIDALGQDDAALPAVHGWVAYVEDRALQWSGRPKSERAPLDAEVERCARAFHVLVEIEGS